MGSTEIINHTSNVMKVKVGINRVFRDLATVEKDGVYKISVDPNTTYQQFYLGVHADGKPIVVDSDQLIDNMRITITESADGKFSVIEVPRQAVVQEVRRDQPPAHVIILPHAAVSVADSRTKCRQQGNSRLTFWKSSNPVHAKS
ncbi:unnamed protein product [Sphagnum jensenii]|uniref:DUF7748 domain-containing protein n=1 Tax=Sphagnum jensenii TaxID=128206 RepID=A0ABP1AXZ2_9BRYO